MNNSFPRIGAGIVGLVLIASSAYGQIFNYGTRDLLLNFREAGGTADLEVNLGSVSNYKNLAPGTTVNLTDKYSVSLQLAPTFTDVNSLRFSVIGTQRGSGVDPANTSWLTLKRADPSIQTTAPIRYVNSKTANIQSAISGIAGDGSSTGALAYAPNASAPSSSTALVIPTSGVYGPNSFSVKYASSGGLASLVNSPGVENTTPSDFASQPGAVIRSDLYEYLPGVVGVPSGSQPAATYLGYFTLANSGVVSYTAVPEPGEYACLFGAGLFGLAVWRKSQRSSKQSAH